MNRLDLLYLGRGIQPWRVCEGCGHRVPDCLKLNVIKRYCVWCKKVTPIIEATHPEHTGA